MLSIWNVALLNLPSTCGNTQFAHPQQMNIHFTLHQCDLQKLPIYLSEMLTYVFKGGDGSHGGWFLPSGDAGILGGLASILSSISVFPIIFYLFLISASSPKLTISSL